jgi:2-oxoglutarate ferredoxin oxidoreductase subunit delta
VVGKGSFALLKLKAPGYSGVEQEKIMSRITVKEEHCKGCLFCIKVCPSKIIVQSQRFNSLGYKVVEVPGAEMERCTGCSACAMVCPDYAIRVYRSGKKTQKENKS